MVTAAADVGDNKIKKMKKKIPRRGNALAKHMASFPQKNAGPHKNVKRENDRLSCRVDQEDEWYFDDEEEIDELRQDYLSELEETDPDWDDE